MTEVYKYQSPYRPLPMNYLSKEIEFIYDLSDIGPWTPKTIYAFSQPIPENQVKNWDLKIIK
jgi:hypothetical protein